MAQFDKLFLHVGLEKTGTTSIQRSLDTHRARIAELGLYYPHLFAVGRNTLLGAMFHRDPGTKKQFANLIAERGGSQPQFVERLNEELQTELAGVDSQSLVLSSEFLASYADVGRLKAFGHQLAERTEVVLYLRDPASLLLSRMSTHVRAGGTEFGALKTIMSGRLPPMIDFRRIVSGLEADYDRADITIRLFDRKELVGASAVQDFLSVVGLGAVADDLEVPPQNESLSRPAVELLRTMNEKLGTGPDDVALRRRLIADLTELDRQHAPPRARLSLEQARQVTELTAAPNAWVRERYFPDRSDLFESPSPTAAESDETNYEMLGYTDELLSTAARELGRDG